MPKHNKGTFSKVVEKAKGIKILLALATVIIIGIVSFTAYFAKSSELEVTNIELTMVEQRLDIKIIDDKIFNIKREIREEVKWLRDNPNNDRSIDAINKLEDTLEKLQDERGRLYEK